MIPEKNYVNSVQNTLESQEQLLKKIAQLEAEKQEMRKQHNLELQQLERELSEFKSRFITTVSHEFRTPLTTISLSAGLLENSSYKISEAKKQTHFQRIKQGIDQIISLLEDILMIDQLEFGQLEINLTLVNLEKTCRIIVDRMQPKTANHQIIFDDQGSNSEGVFDEFLLKQLIENLLSNAIKYSPQGGEIKCELSCKNQQAILKIQDQGIGIPKSDQERVFSNFYRGTNIDTISGRGLGLSLVKKIVDLHHGEIRIESQEDVGTLVEVSLPIKTYLESENST